MKACAGTDSLRTKLGQGTPAMGTARIGIYRTVYISVFLDSDAGGTESEREEYLN
jgi:hypothetical protein